MPEPTLDTTAAAAAPESPPAETGPGATVPGASTTTTTKVPRKRFGGRKTVEALRAQQAEKDGKVGAETNIEETAVQIARPRKPRTLNAIPDDILNDPDIIAAHSLLPATYNFELPKTIHFLRRHAIRRAALQLPEGLLIFACTLSDIFQRFCPGLETVIMGDVTYGACCIDDFTAAALGCDAIVHYAHSCLIPMTQLKDGLRTLYVFVGIAVDVPHFCATIERNFAPGAKLGLLGTVQFNAAVGAARDELLRRGFRVEVPQIAPLSRGEVLGCTSPVVASDADGLVYLGDGRFHLESAMIQNPKVKAYRYDPYDRKFTRELYDHGEMFRLRREAIGKARRAGKWGLILGTLGRQGNANTLGRIEGMLKARGTPFVVLLLSEIFPGKLKMFADVEAWVQVACPRLSIDWGYAFPRPLLSPYEALVALGEREEWKDVYPMDFYGKDGLGRTKKPDPVAVKDGG